VDVVGVASGTIDLVVEVDRLPGHDEKVNGRLIGWLPGGPVPNFACAASRLGLSVGLLGSVGDDAAGQLVIQDLQRYGVDTRCVAVRRGHKTNMTVIFLDATGEKAIVIVPTYEDPPELSDADNAYLEQARIVYTMSLQPDRFLSLAQAAHGAGAWVAIDLEPTVLGSPDELDAVLARTDLVFCNRQGLEAAYGGADEAAARQLLGKGPCLAVVTLGREGSLAVTRDQSVRCPGFEVPVADTTGAGDCFNAAFVAEYLWHRDLARASRFANAAGALSVTRVGPRGWLPTREEVERSLHQWLGAGGQEYAMA